MPIPNLLIYQKTGGPEVCIPAKTFAAVQEMDVEKGERALSVEVGPPETQVRPR